MYTPGADSNARHSATLSHDNPAARATAAEAHEVAQVTLDSHLARDEYRQRSIDLLKVDVEGYELEVFKGAVGVLAAHHPLIFCEIEGRHNAAYSQVFRLLRGSGYRSFINQGGVFRPFEGEDIEALQTSEALAVRLEGSYDPVLNLYVNNFVFQHPLSRIKVSA